MKVDATTSPTPAAYVRTPVGRDRLPSMRRKSLNPVQYVHLGVRNSDPIVQAWRKGTFVSRLPLGICDLGGELLHVCTIHRFPNSTVRVTVWCHASSLSADHRGHWDSSRELSDDGLVPNILHRGKPVARYCVLYPEGHLTDGRHAFEILLTQKTIRRDTRSVLPSTGYGLHRRAHTFITSRSATHAKALIRKLDHRYGPGSWTTETFSYVLIRPRL